MTHRHWPAALQALLLLTAASPLPAQQTCSGCEWSARGDRSEGVQTRSPMIAGGSFELMSVAYLGGRGPETGEHSLRLTFWMPAQGELDELRVWAPLPSANDREKVSYAMEPSRRKYPAGRAEFAWPSGEVVTALGLPLESLHVLIRSGETYLPGLLSTLPGAASPGYGFVFESSAGIDADCDIVRAGDGARVRSMECYEELGGTIVVTWDGRTDDGELAADGEYLLQVDGDMLAETIRPLEASVLFRHRSSLE